MFGKKKREEAEPPEKTETIEMQGRAKGAAPQAPQAPKLAEIIAQEYVRDWQGFVDAKELTEMSDEGVQASEFNLLWAVYGELRQIRDILAHQVNK